MTARARPITPQLLDEFAEWTQKAEMFTMSPEGRAFGEEMRTVIHLARIGLKHEHDLPSRDIRREEIT
jgi:hypothetical protein